MLSVDIPSGWDVDKAVKKLGGYFFEKPVDGVFNLLNQRDRERYVRADMKSKREEKIKKVKIKKEKAAEAAAEGAEGIEGATPTPAAEGAQTAGGPQAGKAETPAKGQAAAGKGTAKPQPAKEEAKGAQKAEKGGKK